MKKFITTAIAICCSLGTLTAQPVYTHVECGTEFTLALRSDSTLWEWGVNDAWQLGDSVDTSTDTPIQVMPSQKWIYAATGAFHTMAIAADSTLWGWGYNLDGELGTGSTDTDPLPVQIDPAKHWRFVSGGWVHTVAILNDGTLWATGYNGFGQLGTGDTTERLSLTQIGTGNDWKTVSAGGVFTLAVKQNGTLWGWGYNGDGELGMNNTNATYATPTQIGTDTNWTMVSSGFEFSLAMKSDGTIWSTGFNGNGQLGISPATPADSVFMQIGTANDWKFIATGGGWAFAIKNNGTLWGWGFNTFGQLGIASMVPAEPVLQIGTDTTWQFISGADGALAGGSVFGLHSAGFKTGAYTICSAGADYEGQLGNGEIINLPGGQGYFGCSVGPTTNSVPGITAAPGDIVVYPNPAFETLTVAAPGNITHIAINNLYGQNVFEQAYNASLIHIDISHLPPGVYFININGAQVKKFIKE